jgi:hypothetical protein
MGRRESSVRDYTRIPYPEPAIFDTSAHLILHIDANVDRGNSEILPWEGGRHTQRTRSVTITLGWHDRHDQPVLSDAKQREAVRMTLEYMRKCDVFRVNIILSPYLESNDHRYCFPTIKPRDIPARTMNINSITFRSSCACGRGNSTGCEHATHEDDVLNRH